LKQRSGDLGPAVNILNGLESSPLPGQDLPLRAYAALLSGPDSAAAWLAAHPAETRLEPDPGNEFLLLTIARLLASSDSTNEAIALLQKIIRFAQKNGRIHTLIQAKTALAVNASQPETLLEALTLAEPEEYLSTFVMEGKPMANQLQHLLRQPDLEPGLQAYTRKILSAFDHAPQKPKQTDGPVEPLSEREIEVLRYIAQGLSNPEIARRMYLSPNTLKAHTQNIFLKLEVHNRVQAVEKARETGLIK
jgi:LuxR family maltose regulon positive regulatory protein